ncbi:hypothetical protein DFP94_104261 [Fontibacillus phaseoli]|uniref:Uncharacterized protein n=1 Tax=Fontibacillus phaseoli TaxID=1416533 RepID=A0A369BGW5_9BACL|nr:hypothetical protein [Fontibacillus phaseoli]RCX19806.1 hypothetical protein DFP94_104261 [Fontibacillus phaseoli]
MPSPLTEKEVNRLFQLLDDIQLNFLQIYLKQSKKSKWLEKLAYKKGIVLHSNISLDEIWEKLNDWELKEILDGGYGNRPYKCECGITLRYCYIVHHRKENKTYQLGETCLGNYTMMSAELIKDITNGFHKIDLERDEILIRYEQGWELPTDYNELHLIEDLKTQIDIGLPFSSIQVNKIEKMFQHELLQIRRQKERDRLAQLRKRQSTFDMSSGVYSFSHSRIQSVTYEEVISQHLANLKQIREHENRITYPLMLEKWNNLQDMIKDLKRGEDFDYSKFLAQMFELLYYLNLY